MCKTSPNVRLRRQLALKPHDAPGTGQPKTAASTSSKTLRDVHKTMCAQGRCGVFGEGVFILGRLGRLPQENDGQQRFFGVVRNLR